MEPAEGLVLRPDMSLPEAAPQAGARSRRSWLRDFALRMVTGLSLAGIVIGALLAGLLPTALMVGVIIVALCWEFHQLSRALGHPAPIWLLVPLALYLALLRPWQVLQIQTALVLSVMLGLTALLSGGPSGSAFVRWSLALGGALYLGLPFSYYLDLYTRPSSQLFGAGLVMSVASIAILGDVAAYVVGSRFGKRPFFPSISPHKTWEGALAGVGGSLLAAEISFAALGLPLLAGAGIGLVLALGAQAGDLVESQLKRLAKAKDSGQILPGHGGILDRFDSLLFPPILAAWLIFGLHLVQLG